MTGYDYSRIIFNWSFENPEKTNPTLIAIFIFLVEVKNRLGWKDIFGITAKEVQEACGIKSYNTFKKNFDLLIEYGFIKVVEKSKNQYTANVIALSNFNKALDKALDKALAKHLTKQGESTCDIHKTNKQVNNKTNKQINIGGKCLLDFWNNQKIIKHEEISDKAKEAVKEILKKYSDNDVLEAVENYSKVIHDKEYFFSYKWTLEQFLKRKEGFSSFLPDGSKWINYVSYKQTEERNSKEDSVSMVDKLT